MNISIYLPQKLASQLSSAVQQEHSSKNAIIREALEEWLERHHPTSTWPSHFFDFQAVKEAPDFSETRAELLSPKEDIF